MTSKLAIGVLAAKAPRILEQTLRNWHPNLCRVYLHVDAKFDLSDYAFAQHLDHVEIIEPRVTVQWGGFSMVEAEFLLLEAAARDGFEFFVLHSDDAVPLLSAEQMLETLRRPERWISVGPTNSDDIRTRYDNFHCMDAAASNPHSPQWHFEDSDLKMLGELAALRTSGKFPLPNLFWSSQWKCLSQNDTDYLLRRHRAGGHLFDSFRFSAISDEHYVPTLLGRRAEGAHAVDKFLWADFNRDPRPYVFSSVEELQPARDHDYLFIRKVHNPDIARASIDYNFLQEARRQPDSANDSNQQGINATTPILDPMGYAFDHPDERDLELFQRDVPYVGSDLSLPVYERARGQVFSTYEDAYRDWISIGRAQGLAYAEGRDTLLKIILKVKDENFFIEHWIDYHASIVGYHNIIIFDCGSTDPDFLLVLENYKERILIIKYDQYYDNIHSPWSNWHFYTALVASCRYVTVIDADEFLFGYSDGIISAANVRTVLLNNQQKVYAGIWLGNIGVVLKDNQIIDWAEKQAFHINVGAVISGSYSGKTVIRSDVLFASHYIGHNMHVREVVSLFTPESFGKIGIFHITDLPVIEQRRRALRHLRAKAVIPDYLVTEEEITAHVERVLNAGNLEWSVEMYLRKYYDPKPETSEEIFETKILDGVTSEKNQIFSANIEAADFHTFLDERRGALGLEETAIC